MGKINGFLEIDRQNAEALEPLDRIQNFMEFHIPLSEEQQTLQGARCMDCGVPFCQYGQVINGMVSGCPLNNLIPEWNDLVYHGNYEAALKRLLKTSNFPEFTSRVCPALCEKACTCSLNGDAVSVKENEHAIIEYGYEHGLMKPQPPLTRTNHKIAIVGSGPAGLAAADQLNQRGYNVDVYEREDRLGGLLMYGIPQMKIEKDIIDRRIDKMTKEGINFYTNHPIENKKQANKLLKDYDAIVLACGAKQARDIKVPGREASNIYFAVDYLTQVTKSLLNSDFKDGKYPNANGKNVLIIGGGDTGNDCVGTAIRHGCKSVTQLEMMGEPPLERAASNPWPEWPLVKKTDYGQEESIAVFNKDPRIYQTTVKEFILNDKGLVEKAVLVKLTPKKENGRTMMVPIEGSEQTIDCDLVLIAAGFVGCEKPITKAFGVNLTNRGNVATEENQYATNVEKVYTAGDMHRGQSLVVWAIREGREVARNIDKDLMGFTNL
ncbi:MAG: glutamate synthase subunit beta [Erysipelotrichaceae bacterium]|nr:glutamate synthase subunit beta [Erysipelotrichaceae bacterium]